MQPEVLLLKLEILNNPTDLPERMRPDQVRRVLRPGGVLVFDTINRTYQSYLLTIVLAQEPPLGCQPYIP